MGNQGLEAGLRRGHGRGLRGGDSGLGKDLVSVGAAVDDQALASGHAAQGGGQLGVQEAGGVEVPEATA